jgi:hypothetical protein
VIFIADSHGISTLKDQLYDFSFRLEERFMSLNSSVVNEDSLLSKLNIVVASYTNVNDYTIEQKANHAKILLDRIGKNSVYRREMKANDIKVIDYESYIRYFRSVRS